MKQLIKDKTLMDLLIEFKEVDDRFTSSDSSELQSEWELKLKRVNRRLKTIKTGRIRWVNACQYNGTGEVRIDDLAISLTIDSFHKSSLDQEYVDNETIVEFDSIELELYRGPVSLSSLRVHGLRGPIKAV